MKKITRILILVIVVGILGFGLWFVRGQRQQTPTISSLKETFPTVTCVFNSISYSDIQASSPYEALLQVAKKNNSELQTKQYDFGIFVEGVGDQKMTKDKAWIYYVNGKSGEVASDKYELKQGDIVEWKYTTPIY
ncbi:MAG: hypothetical protein UU25_C0013G0005 [Microgenomates group bacterium GW2011_GWB1_40_9]|nr:MAG: hypothetical protein UT26_C0027G0005 [Microgenomates group bacterium GW2011_GWC1_39_12]KKR79468.1 MAG: hypothetical protein UU25_C0013G0005 [Microgenomates group bacterium GW2011_GWB1_40_9]